jgi:hypothetical protein
MAVSIEELRQHKERLEKEREDVERRLQDALRKEKEEIAARALPKLWDLTARIEALKVERQQLLDQAREAAPRLGDFTYGSDDYKLTLAAARTSLKQPELLDKVLAALAKAELHVEPRLPRFRLFRRLSPVGTLHVSRSRISLAAVDCILDGSIIEATRELVGAYPGLATLELASETRVRRVREGIASRLPDGDFALSISFHANDTGSLDAILPLAMRALDHVAAYRDHFSPAEEARLFEAWPA